MGGGGWGGGGVYYRIIEQLCRDCQWMLLLVL